MDDTAANTLRIEMLSREPFAPFGDVIEPGGARHYPINEGTTMRFHDLARIDVGDHGGHPLLNVFRGQPRALPFRVAMLERHPLGSQAFIPLSAQPWLVVVAPPGPLDPAGVRAFLARNGQGVNYAKGVWHHPLIALNEVSDFLVVDRGGSGANLDEQNLPRPCWLTQDAFTVALAAPA